MVRARRARGASGRADAALILRRFPYGESSLVVHVLSRDQGRVNLLAKGAYRPTSGYCGVLDLFDTLELAWSARREGELCLLTGASVEIRRRRIPTDRSSYAAALAALELTHLVAREGQAETALFGLATTLLDALDGGRIDARLAVLSFDLKLLHELGLAPALESCAACGAAKEPGGARSGVPFASGAGGRLCRRCAAEASASGRTVTSVPLHALKIARSLMDAPSSSLEHTHLAESSLAAVAAVVQRFLEYHLESRPRAHSGALSSPRRPPR